MLFLPVVLYFIGFVVFRLNSDTDMLRRRQETSRVDFSKLKTGVKDLSNFVWFSDDDSGIGTHEPDDLNIMTNVKQSSEKPPKLRKFSSDNVILVH